MMKVVNNAMHVMTDIKYVFYRNHTVGLPRSETGTAAIDDKSGKTTETYLPPDDKL